MTLSGYINTFLLLAVLSIHPIVTSAEHPPVKSALSSDAFPATPNNYNLLCDSQALKNSLRLFSIKTIYKAKPTYIASSAT